MMIHPADEDAEAPQRSLRRLTIGIGAAIGLCGFILIALIAFLGWRANGNELAAERSRIDNALTQSVERTLEQQKTIAWWDDAVTHVANRFDLDFVDVNFGFYFTETFTHDEVYILDGENRPVYAFAGGERAEPSAYARRAQVLESVVATARGGQAKLRTDRTLGFTAKQDSYNVLKGALRSAKWGAKITLVDGKPAVVAAMTIVPNVDLSLLRGTPYLLVSVVDIDPAFVGTVGGSLLIENLHLGRRDESAGSTVSEVFVTDDGQDGGTLSWTTSQPGQPLLTVVLPLVLIGVLGMWFLSARMLRRLTAVSSELSENEAAARHRATYDALSGLPNRLFFTERAAEVMAACAADPAAGGIVVGYLDIDRFKDINDTLGHQTGDELIRQVGLRLRARLDADCFVARFGGDEFAILRRRAGNADDDLIRRSMAGAFAAPLMVDGVPLRVTVSLGLARSPDHGATPEELMRHADIALYVAKRQGRDQAVFFDADMAQELKANREIEVELRDALERGGLELFFQPIVSAQRQRVTGVEALLRWFHPVKGAIAPSVFIPIAEETGLMLGLGDWVLREAIGHAARWPGLDVAINLSPAQFRHSDLPSLLKGLVDEAGIEAGRITLEITEGLLLERSACTKAVLERIRAFGFRIALDDFGTGFSSLKYLVDFRFDKLKIDRSFVGGLHQANSAQTIIRSVAQLGRAMGMAVIAEGVETGFEATVMQALGCDGMQGYYFSRPMPAGEVAGFIRDFEGAGAAPASVPDAWKHEPAATAPLSA